MRAKLAPLKVTVFEDALGAMTSNEAVLFRSPCISNVLLEIDTDRRRYPPLTMMGFLVLNFEKAPVVGGCRTQNWYAFGRSKFVE